MCSLIILQLLVMRLKYVEAFLIVWKDIANVNLNFILEVVLKMTVVI